MSDVILESSDTLGRPVWLCEALVEVDSPGDEDDVRDRLTNLLTSLRTYGVVHCEVKVLEKL